MDGTSSSPQARRRSTWWILLSLGGCCVLGSAALVLWFWLPKWAPDWVVMHSPFVDPVVRVIAVDLARDRSLLHRGEYFDQRVQSWGPGILPFFVSGLDSADARYRETCLRGMQMLVEQTPLTRGAIERVCEVAVRDVHASVRGTAFMVLKMVEGPEASAARIAGMRDSEFGVRHAVVYALDSRADDRELGLLIATLSDSSTVMRQSAIDRLSDLNERRAIPDLIQVALKDSDSYARKAAISSLRKMKATEAIPALRQVAGSSDVLNAEAIDAIWNIIGIEAVEPLIAALASPDVNFCGFVANRLAIYRDRRAVGPLLALLERCKDSDWWALGHVLIALGKTGDPRAIEPVLARVASPAFTFEHELPLTVPIFTGGFIARPSASNITEAINLLPFSDEQRKRWEALRDK